jgi:voltage-dependent potassium channel beta subunit
MEYRFLGRSGLKVSALSYGAWVTFGDQMDEERARTCMEAAVEHGVNFFDNAEVYAGGRAEEIMGRVLAASGWRRSDLVIATKIFWGGSGPNDTGLSRKHILEGTDAALERLGLRYVDLVFCHRPDPATPIEETVRAMSHLVDTGRAFYWGTSEWSAEQIREAWHVARRQRLVPPTMEQPQYNMLFREKVEREFARLYDEIGLGTTVWSPLASGLLTGKYNDGVPAGSRLALAEYGWLRDMVLGERAEQNIAKIRRLADVARDVGCTQAQLAIAWCLRNPRVSTVITGASSPDQVRENMQALDVVERLTPAVLERIEEILANRPAPEPDFRRWDD